MPKATRKGLNDRWRIRFARADDTLPQFTARWVFLRQASRRRSKRRFVWAVPMRWWWLRLADSVVRRFAAKRAAFLFCWFVVRVLLQNGFALPRLVSVLVVPGSTNLES
jgi:hypothetical protein